MSKADKKPSEGEGILNIRRVLIPIIISIAVAAYILYSSVSMEALSKIKITGTFVLALVGAVLTCFVRDAAYVWRLRILTNNQLTVRSGIRTVLLWEFASAVTPGAFGGSLAALYLLGKENISLGKSSAIVLITAFLDEFIYLVSIPILILFVGSNMFAIDFSCPETVSISAISFFKNTESILVIIYVLLLFIYLLMFYGIFVNPRTIKSFYNYLSKISILKRWSAKLIDAGNDVENVSELFKKQKPIFWIQSILATFISWSARYLLAFFIVWAFSTKAPTLLEIYGKQYFIRTITMIPLSPGGSGISELAFIAMLCQYITSGLVSAAAIIWRFLSYYIYLILGVFLISVSFNQKKLTK